MTVQVIDGRRVDDPRGWFMEVYHEARFRDLGITCRFVQDNHSKSLHRFTLRGLHFQAPLHAQDKLVRCVRGEIFDVAVDIRNGSPTYGRWTGTRLSEAAGNQLFVPAGFAHGFLTLTPDCEIAYKCSEGYAPACEGGLSWNDPALGIAWPLPAGVAPLLSERDAGQPRLADLDSPFSYDGRPLRPVR